MGKVYDLDTYRDERGRALAELRRSGAAGIHVDRTTRSALKREAIEMSLIDSDYPGAFDVEPTKADLDAIEAEGDGRFVDWDDADDGYGYDEGSW